MMREFNVEANVGKPQVAYRETITNAVENYTYLHKKQTGGTGQYAKIVITLQPSGPGGGYEFSDKISGGRIPKEYIPSVGHGVAEAMTTGILAGFPMVDIHVSLEDGDYHEPPARPPRSCWSPSWASRSSPPRTTWVTSSAT
jgi:elongation factor G